MMYPHTYVVVFFVFYTPVTVNFAVDRDVLSKLSSFSVGHINTHIIIITCRMCLINEICWSQTLRRDKNDVNYKL